MNECIDVAPGNFKAFKELKKINSTFNNCVLYTWYLFN